MTTGAGCFDRRIERQQIGLLGNRANDRQDLANSDGFVGQSFDCHSVALHLADQPMQAGQALADDLLAVLHRTRRCAAGLGGFAGAIGHLLDGRLQLAERVANLRGVAGLALGAVMQAAAHLVQAAAAFGDARRLLAQRADQFQQVGTQLVQRGLDVVDLANPGRDAYL